MQRGDFVYVKQDAIPSLVTHQIGYMATLLQKLLHDTNYEVLVTKVKTDQQLIQVSIDSEITWYHACDLYKK